MKKSILCDGYPGVTSHSTVPDAGFIAKSLSPLYQHFSLTFVPVSLLSVKRATAIWQA
jgi:hypothetical protein